MGRPYSHMPPVVWGWRQALTFISCLSNGVVLRTMWTKPAECLPSPCSFPSPCHSANTDTSTDTRGCPLPETVGISSFHSTKSTRFGRAQQDSVTRILEWQDLVLTPWTSASSPSPRTGSLGPHLQPPAWSAFSTPSCLFQGPPQRGEALCSKHYCWWWWEAGEALGQWPGAGPPFLDII